MKNLLFLLLLTSCVTPKKAVDVLSRPKNEPTAAKFCADKFPVQEYYVTGDTLVKIDTLWGLVTDTIETKDTVFKVVTKVEPKVITKTILRVDTAYKENTAKVVFLNSQITKQAELIYSLNRKLNEVSADRDTFKKERNKARRINWILFIVIGLFAGWQIKRFFKW